MPFRTGRVIHEDGGFAIAKVLERHDDGSVVAAGFSLIGPDIDPARRYGSLEDAMAIIDRLRHQSGQS